MAVLSIPVALAITLHCAPTADPAMLVGIARHESGLDPLTLRDNTSDEVLRGPGVIEAARHLIAAAHSVDLGAWQINSRNLSLLGLGVADAFEPCKAAAAAARLIGLFSRYNTGSPSRGIVNGYAHAVLTATRAVKAAGPVPPATATAARLSTSVPYPFTRPAPTGRDFVSANRKELGP